MPIVNKQSSTASRFRSVTRRRDAGEPLQREQKYPVLFEYAKASFKRVKQRVRHLWALARVKRVLDDCTLGSDLDRQFGDLPVGLRKILLSIIHGFARTPTRLCRRSPY